MAGDAHRPLFTPRGIPVRADISLLVIAALVTWSFWSRFIGTFTEAESIAMAVVASALFLLSILAHELAHALEARRRGLIVEDITLYVFGGATRIVSETSRSADEFWLTIVGPWTSIVLGCAFGLVAYGADSAGIRYIAEVAGQLGWLNVLLGAFNLLPGAPLDGGRLLDSVVWRLTGDRSKATAVSTRAGQFLGLAILLLGVAEMLLVEGGFIGGLWLMLIGWFLLRGASAERTMGVIRARLSGLRVSDLIAPVTTVSLGCTVETAADLAFRSGRTDVVVVAGPTGTVGVVTGDALQRVPSERRGWVPVEEVMVPAGSLPTVQCSASAGELLPMLQGGPIVVLDGSDLKSIVTASHLTAALRWLGPSIRGERPAEGQVLTRPATPLVDDRSRSGQAIRLGLWMASGAIVLSSLALVPMRL